MAEIIAAINEEVELDTLEENALYLEMSPALQYPSSVDVIYSADFREITEPRLTMIRVWLSTFAPQLTPAEREEVFGTEGRFVADGEEYWIPVQEPLIQFMKDELEAGDEVNLLLLWMGARPVEDGIDYVFLVNAFE